MCDFDMCQLNVCKNMNGMSFVRDSLKLIPYFSKGKLPNEKAAMKKMWISACLTFFRTGREGDVV